MNERTLSALRWTGYLEALSYVLLVGLAMPLKYAFDSPHAVRWIGMAHGLLFVAYLVAVARSARAHRWPLTKIGAALVASMVPFGPFVIDESLRDPEWRRD